MGASFSALADAEPQTLDVVDAPDPSSADEETTPSSPVVAVAEEEQAAPAPPPPSPPPPRDYATMASVRVSERERRGDREAARRDQILKRERARGFPRSSPSPLLSLSSIL